MRPVPPLAARLLAAVLVLCGSAGLLPASAAPALAPAPAADPGWPRTYDTPTGGRLTLYQPQIAAWDDQRRLVAYAVVAHRLKGGGSPVLGTIRIDADTDVALAERLVRLTTLQITGASFGAAGRDRTALVVRELEASVPAPERVIALDRVLAGLDASRLRPRAVAGVNAEPPRIHVRTGPALLVAFDGPPIWSPIDGSTLRYAVNTNWDVFELRAAGRIYLRDGARWLEARALDGPWRMAAELPSALGRLPDDPNWADVKASLRAAAVAASAAPEVIVTTVPAELVALMGEARYEVTRPGGRLLWVSNTDSDVFRLGLSGPVYYLVAGRWFSAPGFAGPWTFATPTLPVEFTRIPRDHPRARVLASVPGTPEAAEAVLLAGIPQTATVTKAAVSAPPVAYQGAPVFVPIETTAVQRAVNTAYDVLRVGDRYYLCFQGVWFVSALPAGPWGVAGAVPAAIYAIPASSPAHHVTYVTVVSDTTDAVVVAAGAGYSGVTIAWGCAVWGTGWHYAQPSGTAAHSPSTIPTPRPTAPRPGTTPGAARISAGPWRTARTAARALPRGTTPPPAPTLGAPQPGGLTAPPAPRKPTTLMRASTPRRAKRPASTGNGARAPCVLATSGRGRATPPTAPPASRAPASSPTRVPPSAGAGRRGAGSSPPGRTASTRDATATCTGERTAAGGRSTTTARGPTPSIPPATPQAVRATRPADSRRTARSASSNAIEPPGLKAAGASARAPGLAKRRGAAAVRRGRTLVPAAVGPGSSAARQPAGSGRAASLTTTRVVGSEGRRPARLTTGVRACGLRQRGQPVRNGATRVSSRGGHPAPPRA
ncbi:MAG: hypothetical protein R2745_17705 [Vicinamibacterales bacterium]